MNKQEVLLSKEIRMPTNERRRLLRVVGAAERLNALPEEALKDALEPVRAEVE